MSFINLEILKDTKTFQISGSLFSNFMRDAGQGEIEQIKIVLKIVYEGVGKNKK